MQHSAQKAFMRPHQWWTSCFMLFLLLSPHSLSSSAETRLWKLERDVVYATRIWLSKDTGCPLWYEGDAISPIPLKPFSATELNAPGRLVIPPGEEVTLIRPNEDSLRVSGNSSLELFPNGDWLPLASQYGIKEGHGGSAPQLLLFPLIAGERGTRYEYILNTTGEIAIYVFEGRVEIQSLISDEVVPLLSPGELLRYDPRKGVLPIERGERALNQWSMLKRQHRQMLEEQSDPNTVYRLAALAASYSMEALMGFPDWTARAFNGPDAVRQELQSLLNGSMTGKPLAEVRAQALHFSKLTPGTIESSEVLFRAWLICRKDPILANELESAIRAQALPSTVELLNRTQARLSRSTP